MRKLFFSLALAAVTGLAPAVVLAGDAEDKAAAEQIAVMLRDSGKLQGYSVGVKYKKGTVWLSGRVTSDQQMQTALQLVSDIDGIEQIVNGLSVTPTEKPNIKQASAKASTRRSPDVEAPAGASEEVAPAGYHHLNSSHHLGRPMPAYAPSMAPPQATLDQAHMPNYAWPSYAAYPNYAAVTYPKQYSATAFPFIGPFYPYPQVPLGWRKVALEWDDGWWFLDFYDRGHH